MKPRRLTQQLKTADPRVRTRDIPKFGISTYVDATYLVKLPSYTYQRTQKRFDTGLEHASVWPTSELFTRVRS